MIGLEIYFTSSEWEVVTKFSKVQSYRPVSNCFEQTAAEAVVGFPAGYFRGYGSVLLSYIY